MEEKIQSTTPDIPPPPTPPTPSPVKHSPKAFIIVGIALLLCLLGIAGYQYVNHEKNSAQTSNPSPTPKTNPSPTPTLTASVDYRSIFTISLPEGFQEIKEDKGFGGRSGVHLLSIKTPKKYNNEYIYFTATQKESSVALKKYAYDPDACKDSAMGINCGGHYNPPSESRTITVDGRNAIWQRVNSAPAGEKLEILIEKSPTEVIVMYTYAHVENGELDERIIPIVDQILSTFKFIEPTSLIDTSNWKTYTNIKYGYSLKYPPQVVTDIVPERFDESGNYMLAAELVKLEHKTYGTMTVLDIPLDWRNKKVEKITVGGKPGNIYYIDTGNQDSNQTIIVYVPNSLSEVSNFGIRYQIPNTDNEEHLEYLRAILSTVQFTK